MFYYHLLQISTANRYSLRPGPVCVSQHHELPEETIPKQDHVPSHIPQGSVFVGKVTQSVPNPFMFLGRIPTTS